ncbi:tyrosine-type recombinase/integrase [Natrarchaeobaculum sulfurireducens]|uniref:Phage integrase/site-specific recombinase n=1 Tax=Natrarchaeobaculum sulfurireducens TaxID=2044521 RepID=A0A346PMH8_9EURY|nr:site-specific integrase [Natrarchaeobaculum sulfurireducens]AXR80723.1 phage integrase/site-specific recombinase [Natrarchaeobaculum sulfurireducens]
MNPNDLEPLDPHDALNLYKKDRKREVSDATLKSHGYRLKNFVEWCDSEGIDNLNDVTGRDIQRFKIFRQDQGIAPATLKSQMDTLRVFIRFCESINGCIDGLAESINSPSLAGEDAKGTDIVPTQKAESILSHLDKFDYASIHHALFRLLWASGMRMGAAMSIDLQHIHKRSEYVELRHNPETDTPLKNKKSGERDVSLDNRTIRVLTDFIDENRIETTDDHGRHAVFTSRHGRLTRNTVRNYVYRITRPCTYNGGECPHDRDPDECDGMNNMTPYKCPGSTAPHSIRRGAITHYLSEDVPGAVVSDRMDVSEDVIDEHYDERDSRTRMEQRREYVDQVDL